MNNRIIYIGVGAVVGGIGGYLLADLLAWKILEEQFEQEFAEEIEAKAEELFVGLRNEMDGTQEKRVIDYSQYAKAELKDLAEPYETTETGPYVISLNDWLENASEDYDREVISFYAEDGIFADQEENEIKDPNNLFGPNIHLHFGEESDDPDVVYVVNESEGAIFEIVKQHESYAVQVLGETPPEPKKKRGRPRKKPVESSNDE